jgi:hypothetical protein
MEVKTPKQLLRTRVFVGGFYCCTTRTECIVSSKMGTGGEEKW